MKTTINLFLLVALASASITAMQEPNAQQWTLQDQYTLAQSLFHHPQKVEDYDTAHTMLQAIAQEATDVTLKANAQIALGQIYYYGYYGSIAQNLQLAKSHFLLAQAYANNPTTPKQWYNQCISQIYLAQLEAEGPKPNFQQVVNCLGNVTNSLSNLTPVQYSMLQAHTNYLYGLLYVQNKQTRLAQFNLLAVLNSNYSGWGTKQKAGALFNRIASY